MSDNSLFFAKLFEHGERVCFGDAYETKAFVYKGQSIESELFCINPLSAIDLEWNKGEGRAYMTPRRADINVTQFRNFMFEMDSVWLDEQLEILRGCGIPWTTIVYSGGKSYHAILSLEQPLGGEHTENGILNYKHIWSRLAAHIDEVAGRAVIDQSAKNPSRFSRVGGALRYKDMGVAYDIKMQTIHSIGNRISAEAFNELLKKLPELPMPEMHKEQTVNLDLASTDEFWEHCPIGLKKRIKFPRNIASEGMYPELLKTCLWAIDSTCVPKAMLLKILDTYLFPKLLQVGYPEYKMFKAINDAYRMKGVV